jgi:hypothetical protein
MKVRGKRETGRKKCKTRLKIEVETLACRGAFNI